jgi:DNA mismatch endonuclease Vsr
MTKRPTGVLTKSEQMARVRSTNTHPELLLRRALWRMGVRYRVHLKVPGTPDIAFIGPRIAVFVDGCFWHGCPNHYTSPAANAVFWQAKLLRNQARDRQVDATLRAAGWRVLRVWEHEVSADPHRTARRIWQSVRTSAASDRARLDVVEHM